MPPSHHPWLPTTRGQSAVVLTLTVLLMLNTTVLLLVMSERVEGANLFSTRSDDAVTDSIDVRAVDQVDDFSPTPARVEPPRLIEPMIAKPSQARGAEPEPVISVPVIRLANDSASDTPVEPVASPRPEQEEPPAQFFGIDLD